jgi:hypothetical protein
MNALLSVVLWLCWGVDRGPSPILPQKQLDHWLRVMGTLILNATITDQYFERPTPTYVLCDTIDSFMRPLVFSNGSRYPVHNFTPYELTILGIQYMDEVYTPANFPFTYRPDALVDMTNSSAHHIYRIVCKDYWIDPQPDWPGYVIATFMLCMMSWRAGFMMIPLRLE